MSAKYPTSTVETDPVAGASLTAHAADTTDVHGVDDTADLILEGDVRLSDERVPTDGSVTAAKVNGALKPSGSAAGTDESLRRLGTGATHAAAGDDSRFPSSGEKNALAGTSGTPGSGNEYVTDGDARNSDARTPTAHVHPQSDVTSLVSDLAGKQPLDSDLTAIAALSTTAYGRALLALADAAALRSAASVYSQAEVDALHSVASRSFSRYRTGLYYATPFGANPSAGTTLVLDRTAATLLLVDDSLPIDRIGCDVSAGAAGSVIRLGIYLAGSDGAPSSLVLDAGTVDASTNGIKEITVSQTLTRGAYWLTGCMQVATGATARGFAAAARMPSVGVPSSTVTVMVGWQRAGISGAFPDPLPAPAAATSAIQVFVRRT